MFGCWGYVSGDILTLAWHKHYSKPSLLNIWLNVSLLMSDVPCRSVAPLSPTKIASNWSPQASILKLLQNVYTQTQYKILCQTHWAIQIRLSICHSQEMRHEPSQKSQCLVFSSILRLISLVTCARNVRH